VVGLVWSNNPETILYASSSVATGRVCHAGHVRGADPQGCGFECEGKNITSVKKKQLKSANRKTESVIQMEKSTS
jgi:hypothetical protein